MLFLRRTAQTTITRLQRPIQQQQQQRWMHRIARRRQRPLFHQDSRLGAEFPKPQRVDSVTGQTVPYDVVSDKSTLSPWVPLPDAIARKALDMAQAGSTDRHIDLGSGDGRVNFHAVDGFGVEKSLGIEVDEKLVAAANLRLRKRHPLPTNLEFCTADLLADDWEDPNNVWLNVIPQATIITFYFAKPEMIRARLEAALTGKRCKVVSCGYEVPGWESTLEEVILGTHIYVYEFGGDNPSTFRGEDLLANLPREAMATSFSQIHNKFPGAKVIDRTSHFPIRGFDPDSIHEEEDDGDPEDWDEEIRRINEEEAKEAAKQKVKVEKSKADEKATKDSPKGGCGKKK